MTDKIINWLLNDSETFQYVLFFGLIILLTIIEFFASKRKTINTPPGKGKRWSANYALTFFNIVLLSALPVSFMSIAMIAEKREWGLLNQLDLHALVLAVISLFLRGFISFFTHYLAHKIPLLWRIHRVHHLDTELDVSTTVRFHPLEFVVNLMIGGPLIVVFGLPLWALLMYEIMDIAVTLFSHANIQVPEGLNYFLQYIIVTPDLHRIHHSSYQPETDSNFSAVFPVWDILFKTFRTQTKMPQETMELGLEEVRDKRTANIFWLLMSPVKKFKNHESSK